VGQFWIRKVGQFSVRIKKSVIVYGETMRCAIYTRVSTDNQAEKEYNSCEAQEEKIKAYIKSQEGLKLYKVYSDAGFSGASLDRPALKEMLNDIIAGKIDCVLTYKIDRLTSIITS
jgi:DNA invertase Pin-like site-specific DNA recombinase